MMYFRFEAKIANNNWCEINNDRRVNRDNVKIIAHKSDVFNMNIKDEGFFFTDCATDSCYLQIGIICKERSFAESKLKSYLSAIDIEATDGILEEITFDEINDLLRSAARKGFMSQDEDDILHRFDLDKICSRFGRGIEFGENILDSMDKETVYSKAEAMITQDSLLSELDRIYSNKRKRRCFGHPVHYIIQTDDPDLCEKTYGLLLNALYENNRVMSKRHTFFDIRSGEHIPNLVLDKLYKSCTGGTMIVRYYDNNNAEDDHASAGRETAELLCEAMKKYCNQVLTIFCFPREATKTKEIFFENLANTSFIELKEEFISDGKAARYLEIIAKESGIRTDKKLFAKIEEGKGYLTPDLHDIFNEWYNRKLKTGVYPQYKEIVGVEKAIQEARPKGDAYTELMSMIGLDEAKNVINRAIEYNKAQILFSCKGIFKGNMSMHMVFTGNPGTAKTTVARLFADIMKDNGMLSKGRLIEVGRGDLVGKYVGWTAPTIQKKFKEAEGSVLFIDEAYSLVDDRDGSFGDEAINTIVQEMENHRNDVIVIFAGYPDKMEKFLSKNPGLRSRIAYHVPFEDYNTEQLMEIANLMADKKGLILADDAVLKLNTVFDAVRNSKDFGNGRCVRNILEKAEVAKASRIMKMDFESVTVQDIQTVHAVDIDMPVIGTAAPARRLGFSY